MPVSRIPSAGRRPRRGQSGAPRGGAGASAGGARRDARRLRSSPGGARRSPWQGAFKAKIVSAYMPIRDEPDTLPLLQALSDAGFATALPVTVERGRPLDFPPLALRRAHASLGQMKIPEPPPEAETVDPDLLFTPLAAFDRQGHRIGYGAGHYDRSLQGPAVRGPRDRRRRGVQRQRDAPAYRAARTTKASISSLPSANSSPSRAAP